MFPPSSDLPSSEVSKIYFEDPFNFLLECFENYGDIFCLPLEAPELGAINKSEVIVNNKWVFLTKPEDIKAMFSGNPSELVAGEANKLLFGDLIPRTGSLALDGQAHLQRKRLLLKLFQGENIKLYTDTIRDFTLKTVDDWNNEEGFSIFHSLQLITLKTIIRSIFGVTNEQQAQQLCLQLMKVERAETSVEEKKRIKDEISTFLRQEIENRRSTIKTNTQIFNNVMELLLTVKDEEGKTLKHDEIHDELLTLLIAGFGTTATMLAWAFECIVTYPQVYEKVKTELDEKLDGSLVKQQNVDSLKYLDCFIKETLRTRHLLPTMGVRLLKKPWKVNSYTLPEGTIVANCSYLLHMRPELYPEPHEFKPERFDGVKPDPIYWTPFGGGGRTCTGMYFALHEMKVVLATVLSMVSLELVKPVTKPVLQGPFYAPEGGPFVRVIERF